MRRFEELRVWNDAKNLVTQIYAITDNIKDWGFKDQIRRAAISVMNNIAEGSEAGSDANFIKFLNIAKGSCGEVRSMLYLMENLFSIDKSTSAKLIDDTLRIGSNIHNLIIYLEQQQ